VTSKWFSDETMVRMSDEVGIIKDNFHRCLNQAIPQPHPRPDMEQEQVKQLI
jgi:hypothetical protein